tara:strand:+ start:101 stop:415 length:315 start_codon:yes stop_codon:yes gene_type:complete
MKKIILIFLIGFVNCTDSAIERETGPEIEIEKNCYSITSIAQNSRTGRAIICEELFIINVVKREVFLSGSHTIYDRIEICVTNPDIGWNDLRLGQTLCDLSILN